VRFASGFFVGDRFSILDGNPLRAQQSEVTFFALRSKRETDA